MVVEPGTPKGFELIHFVRNKLLSLTDDIPTIIAPVNLILLKTEFYL